MLPLMLCVGQGCQILGAVMLSYFFFWPLYLGLVIAGIVFKYVKIVLFGAILGIYLTMLMYDSTINSGREDLYWIPAGHLLSAFIMFVIFLKNYSSSVEDSSKF